MSQPITVEFQIRKEGVDKITYAETYPHGVVGSFYLARLAAHYKWEGKIPKRLRITIEPMEE